MPTPRVSIVMGAFNDADRLPAAIDGICAQTSTDWELIVVDDGSTDGTPCLLDGYAARDSRIVVIHQENTGLTRALIRGCEAARGEFIARQDADDVSAPTRLQRQVETLAAQPEVGLVSCWAQYVGPEGEPLELVTRPADPVECTRLLFEDHQGPTAHGTVMFRRSLYEQVGGYRPEFYFSQDNDLWLRMTERAQLGCVAETLYQYRRCMGGISGSQRNVQWEFGRLAFECRTARDRGASEAPQLQRAAELADEIRRRQQMGRAQTPPACDMSYLIGAQLTKNGDPRAVKYLWNVVRQQPWHWRAWGRMLQSGWRVRPWSRSTSASDT